jgi:enoyl-CoA hydratase/carnithine racemase
MSDRVQITVADGVADVRLNRPDKMNALDLAMFRALVEAADEVRADRRVRAIVLSGVGRSFCAGLDMAMFTAQADEAPSSDEGITGPAVGNIVDRMDGRITNLFQEAVHGWTDQRVPVLAALHGAVLGGGLQLALGADIRFVAPGAKLSVLEIRWGLAPDMTGPQTLPRIVGLDVAKELTFTGRMVWGEEAVQLGLATHLTETPLDDALALAAEIAGKNPRAIQDAKALFDAAGTRPLLDSFVDESTRMAANLGTPNQIEAVMAQLEGRPPVFADPD